MASGYRKIFCRLWRDEKVRSLKPLEKLVLLYALTGQSNRIGLFVFSHALAAEDLGLNNREFTKALRTVCRTLGWVWDERAGLLWIRRWWRYNRPENPNNLIGNLKDLAELPSSPLVQQFAENIADLETPDGNLLRTFRRALAERYPQGFTEPSRTQEQKQEPEKEQEADDRPDQKLDDAHGPERDQPQRVATVARTPHAADGAPSFELFWSAYPRKEGKKKAQEAWKALQPDAALVERILGALAWQRQTVQWLRDGGRFIPHATTYLHQSRWEDEEAALPRLSGTTAANLAAVADFIRAGGEKS